MRIATTGHGKVSDLEVSDGRAALAASTESRNALPISPRLVTVTVTLGGGATRPGDRPGGCREESESDIANGNRDQVRRRRREAAPCRDR